MMVCCGVDMVMFLRFLSIPIMDFDLISCMFFLTVMDSAVGVITKDRGCSVLSERIFTTQSFSKMFANSLLDTGKDSSMPLILKPWYNTRYGFLLYGDFAFLPFFDVFF
jgi:hypothetical protein